MINDKTNIAKYLFTSVIVRNTMQYIMGIPEPKTPVNN